MIFSAIVLLVFPVLMIFAASSDLLTMRISNLLVLMLVVGFFILALVVQMPVDQILAHLGCAAVVLIVAFAFFAFGWIGGGDAKLAAATTLWIGVGLILPYIVYSGLLGGALTLLILALRNLPLPALLQRVTWIDRLHDKKQGVPYGIALAIAGLLVYPQSMIFQHFLA
ncbi:MAG: peptidase [Hyphomicrobiales bacterium]|nr:MAG: peptidase [Hyphomicrobiales bacterium]